MSDYENSLLSILFFPQTYKKHAPNEKNMFLCVRLKPFTAFCQTDQNDMQKQTKDYHNNEIRLKRQKLIDDKSLK